MVRSREKHIGWILRPGKVAYQRSLDWQRGLVKLRKSGMARDTIIFVEHPPVITVGKDGHKENYQNIDDIYQIERGGDVTYHGPGQLVVYFIFNLTRRGRDLHQFMENVQEGIIETFEEIGIKSKKGDEYTGIWIKENKIASIGVAVKNWITFHGAAINLNTNLEDFKQINPCGLKPEIMITAEQLLNKKIDMDLFIDNLLDKYSTIFETRFYPIKLEDIAEDIESQSGSNVI